MRDRLVKGLAAPLCPTTLALMRIVFAALGVAALSMALQESQWLGGPEIYRPHLWMDWLAGRSPETVRIFLCLGIFLGMTSMLGLVTPISLLGLWLVLLNLRNHLAWADSEGGLQVVQCALLCLLWTPCGLKWSLDSRFGWCCKQSLWGGPIRVLQLLQIIIYVESGVYKLMGINWWDGSALLRVTQNLNFSRLAGWFQAPGPLVAGVMSLATWIVLLWELAFPLLLLWRPSRRLAIGIGLVMHLSLWLFFDVGLYPPAMLALYLTYLPGRSIVAGAPPSRWKKGWVGLHAAMLVWAVLPVHRVYPKDPALCSPVPGLASLESAAYRIRQSLLNFMPIRVFQRLVDNLGLNHRYNTFSPTPANLSVFFRLRDEHGALLWSDAPAEGVRYSLTVVLVRTLATTAPQALPLYFQKVSANLGMREGLVLEEWIVELGQPASAQVLNQSWSWRPAPR
ncbi:MAG: HTTM domain-containing protein [Candidatus Eremiobacteraeota bacterium]|nr:HTTM domain-containing protein [Candidatus Eremiobacteraeota bacterium]MCW5871861.1 HTTM domain-containing protein [Candidatus Eremiobacteraeota bacterium]